MIDSIRVGEKITTLRKKANMSQEQLASAMFISRQALSKWETGNAVPTLEMLLALTKIFDASFEEILCLNEELNVNPDDIFANHNRKFIVRQIALGKLDVAIPTVINQLSPSERLYVLREIREGRLTVNRSELTKQLTLSEQRYLGGKSNDSQESNER